MRYARHTQPAPPARRGKAWQKRGDTNLCRHIHRHALEMAAEISLHHLHHFVGARPRCSTSPGAAGPRARVHGDATHQPPRGGALARVQRVQEVVAGGHDGDDIGGIGRLACPQRVYQRLQVRLHHQQCGFRGHGRIAAGERGGLQALVVLVPVLCQQRPAAAVVVAGLACTMEPPRGVSSHAALRACMQMTPCVQGSATSWGFDAVARGGPAWRARRGGGWPFQPASVQCRAYRQ